VIVYLWDSHGPGRFCGVTDDDARARSAAEECIASGQATAAQVELAQLVSGFAAMTAYYVRMGEGWRAQYRDGRTTWVPLAPSEVS
jgi:hypothetical protein